MSINQSRVGRRDKAISLTESKGTHVSINQSRVGRRDDLIRMQGLLPGQCPSIRAASAAATPW